MRPTTTTLMMTTRAGWRLQIALGLLAAALALTIAAAYRATFSGESDSCCMSEWLINYGGGFVRRGLGGALILRAASVFGTSPREVVFVILVGCYTTFFASLAVMASRVRNFDSLELLLTVSPFAALFPVIHHVAGQRKEALLLALAALGGATGLGRLDNVWKYLGWSLALGAIVAIHDGSIFFLPLLVIYLRVVTPPAYPMGYRGLLLLLPAAGVFLWGYLRSPAVDTTAICAAMNAAGPGNWCGQGTSVVWLHATALDGLRAVISEYTSSATVPLVTLLYGAAGLVPVAFALRREKSTLRRAIDDLPFRRLFVWLSGFAVVVVFCVAEDGNRWFYIVTVLLTLMYFSARYDAQDGRLDVGGRRLH